MNTKEDIKWMTASKFAQEIGVSAMAVSKAIKSNRFDEEALRQSETKSGQPRYLIHMELGKAQWEDNKKHNAIDDYECRQALYRKQKAQADIAEMKAADMASKLVRRDDVHYHLEKIFSFIRKEVLASVPTTVAKVVNMTDVKEIENTLLLEHTALLTSMSNRIGDGDF